MTALGSCLPGRVNTENFNESGRLHLELANAAHAEAARGMALLTKLME